MISAIWQIWCIGSIFVLRVFLVVIMMIGIFVTPIMLWRYWSIKEKKEHHLFVLHCEGVLDAMWSQYGLGLPKRINSMRKTLPTELVETENIGIKQLRFCLICLIGSALLISTSLLLKR